MFKIKTLFLCLLTLFCEINLEAQEAARPWKDVLEISAVSTNGTSKATTAAAKNNFTFQRGRYGLETVTAALGSESENKVTAEQYSASEKGTLPF